MNDRLKLSLLFLGTGLLLSAGAGCGDSGTADPDGGAPQDGAGPGSDARVGDGGGDARAPDDGGGSDGGGVPGDGGATDGGGMPDGGDAGPDGGGDGGMDGGADGGADGGMDGGADGGDAASTAGVMPLYPANGAEWNAYVSGDGTGLLDASDTACDASAAGSGPAACLHGGELRVLSLPSFSDCTSVSIADDLGAFDWICDASTGTVRAVSVGLKDGMYLSDLIDFDASPPAWKENAVTAVRGSDEETSGSSVWWTNPVVESNGGGDLTGARTIHVVTTDPNATYAIGSDGIALVVEPGVTLTGPGTGAFAVVQTFERNFLWLEGELDVTGDSHGVRLGSLNGFVVARNVQIRGASNAAFHADFAGSGRFEDLTLTDSGGWGLTFSGDHAEVRNVVSEGNASGIDLKGSFTRARDLVAASNADLGVVLGTISSEGCELRRVVATGNQSPGLVVNGNRHRVLDVYLADNGRFARRPGMQVQLGSIGHVIARLFVGNSGGTGVDFRANDSVLMDVVAAHNGLNGVDFVQSDGSVLLNTTTVNGGGFFDARGLSMSSGEEATVMNLAAVNNQREGLGIGPSFVGARLHNVAITDNLGGDLFVENNSGDITFSGILRVGNASTSCDDDTPSGVDDACSNEGSSTSVLAEGSATGAFVGKVLTDDADNASDTDGSASYDADLDWRQFARALRGWGKEVPFPGSTTGDDFGRCESGDTCRIWDWNLDATDVSLRGVVATPADGDEVLVHAWNASSSSDCAEIAGATWDEGASSCTTTMLRHAVEVLDDGSGNDNGLCESDETCLVTPNIGAYQGHGATMSAGSIGASGAISNVTLVSFEHNGY